MTLRHVTEDIGPRPSARIKTVAAMLDADPAIVRRLVNAGEIEAHTIGKRGVRIYLDSVADYQARQGRQTRATTPKPQQRRHATRAAVRAALAGLEKLGVRL